jgi:hypothetical protein
LTKVKTATNPISKHSSSGTGKLWTRQEMQQSVGKKHPTLCWQPTRIYYLNVAIYWKNAKNRSNSSKKWRIHKFVARNVVNFMGNFPKILWTMLLGPKVFGNMMKICHRKNHCSRVKKM